MVLGMCFFEVEIKYKLEAKITFFNKNHKNQSADTFSIVIPSFRRNLLESNQTHIDNSNPT